ncbi:vegetative cell wall protein gp1-like [Miscanthus floridulus]|uniref:vegetative cell wall protein gp1-like n=1 Tax=Miscanthus floridulus TaxID=154761 RepID=UPI00345761BE
MNGKPSPTCSLSAAPRVPPPPTPTSAAASHASANAHGRSLLSSRRRPAPPLLSSRRRPAPVPPLLAPCRPGSAASSPPAGGRPRPLPSLPRAAPDPPPPLLPPTAGSSPPLLPPAAGLGLSPPRPAPPRIHPQWPSPARAQRGWAPPVAGAMPAHQCCIRYQREEAKIQAWINLESAKAEAQSRKLESALLFKLRLHI